MAGMSRRNMIGAAATGGFMVAASTAIAQGDQPRFGPTSAILSGKELPSFRFPLASQPVKTYDGGWAQEATVASFPVSEKLAGVLMQLSPGTLREMHWHTNAAEWAYVIKGRCRVTTIDPQAHAEVVDFEAGDVWYFPLGHGHSIQGLGPGDCQFILVFDNGHFAEFGAISASDWFAHTPPHVLAKNLGVPETAFAGFPKHEIYMAKGAVPPPLPSDPAPGSLRSGAATHHYRLLAQRPDRFPGGSLRLVSEREFPISTTMAGLLMRLKPGGLRELHWHPNADEWQYYVKGRARMTVFGSHGRARTEEFAAGDVGYVPQGYGHYIENAGPDDLEVVIALNNGRFESIAFSAWMAATPANVLATNFGVPESTFANFSARATIMPD